MSSAGVRPAAPSDAAAVHRVTQAAWAEHADLDPPTSVLAEDEGTVRADLASGTVLVAEAAHEVVAALRLQPGPGGLLWVRRVAVRPDHRRRGLAALLLRAAEDLAARSALPARLRLQVRHVLPGSRRLYERLGWAAVERHDFYDTLALPVPLGVPTAAAMRDLGSLLAREVLRAGDLVLLDGPLGAGKTTLAQGVGAGLAVRTPVRSPTYTLADEHAGTDPRTGAPLRLLHLDAWRLAAPAEVDDLDLDLTGAVTVVEWGADRAEQLAEDHLLVRLGRPAQDDGRTALLVPHGGAWAERLAAAGLL